MITYKTENKISLRVEVLRDGGVISTLEPYTYPEIQNVTSSALKMSLRGSFLPAENIIENDESEKNQKVSIQGTVEGAVYGFAYNQEWDMMVSQNKGKESSAAVCRIDVETSGDCTLVLDCVNSAEGGYDYGVIYNVDYTPSMGASLSSGTFMSFSGKSVEDISQKERVSIPIPEGNHFVYIKYMKDSSINEYLDVFAFQVVSCILDNPGEPEIGINWMMDRIRPILNINGIEYPCGVFIATTPGKRYTGGNVVWDIEAYSVLYLASRVQIEGTYNIKAGTNYISAVQELLQRAGITNYEVEETSLKLATDRADWPSGTPILTVINKLLSEINYRSAWVDLNGVVRITKYTAPSADNIRHTYTSGEYSMISDDATVTTDYFNKANVFRAVCPSPDLGEPLVAVAENNDPKSPYSTISLGVRILQTETVDSVPDLGTLQERADIMLTKSLQTTEKVEFVTALNPTHESWDTVALDLGEITGMYTETGWSMTLDASGEMRHTAERVVYK